MTENPYEVSPSCGSIEVGQAKDGILEDSHWYHVDGDDVVCHGKVRLPPICIFTGSDHDLVHVLRGVRPVIYLPWNWRKSRCLVFFRVERQRWVRHRRWRLSAEWLSIALLMGAALAVVFSREAQRHVPVLRIVVIPLFVILQVTASRLKDPIRYVAKEGRLYRIRGFGPDALKRLRELQPANES